MRYFGVLLLISANWCPRSARFEENFKVYEVRRGVAAIRSEGRVAVPKNAICKK
jgi:hypothetical protein